MKRNLFPSHKSEHGYAFPYILFIISIFLLFTFHQLALYDLNRRTTYNQIEQYKLHTIYRMATNAFSKNMSVELPVTYSFPYGEAKLESTSINGNIAYYLVKMRTDKGAYQRQTFQRQYPK
ncbi:MULTISPECIES: hypothetical protein [Gracilibacillus]|uniref:Competence protein ComG n=1 Tax=Gracilibacillus dipsosauri TaxID=178340 RepID=A0A317KZ68_9BACI|nr:hypothetical protein [Gracilibacillus dipsosauri]PWU68526.1 hypothetical protein DLJ74_08800 [Gracilibacillus dipsosauri]